MGWLFYILITCKNHTGVKSLWIKSLRVTSLHSRDYAYSRNLLDTLGLYVNS